MHIYSWEKGILWKHLVTNLKLHSSPPFRVIVPVFWGLLVRVHESLRGTLLWLSLGNSISVPLLLIFSFSCLSVLFFLLFPQPLDSVHLP